MLYRILFESLVWLVAVWVAVQFVMIAIWSWRRTRVAAYGVCAGFAALPLLLLLSSFVRTDREQVIHICYRLARAVEASDVATIRRQLADDFQVDRFDAEAFLERLTVRLSRVDVADVTLSHFACEWPREGTCRVTFTASAFASTRDFGRQFMRSKWRLTFNRRNEAWRLVTMESIPVPPLNLADVGRWLQ